MIVQSPVPDVAVIVRSGRGSPEQILVPPEIVAFGNSFIVISSVALAVGHPATLIVFVTVYVPGVLAPRSTSPVLGLITNPAVDENVPPDPPLI